MAVCCSNASFSSRVSRATFVSWLAAEEELRRRADSGALRRFTVTAFRRRALTGLPPALERRLIASLKHSGQAASGSKLAHWLLKASARGWLTNISLGSAG